MISYANKKCNAYGVRNLVLDTDADVANLPKSAAGSTAYVIESGDRYICNSKGEWKKAMAGNNSGGGNNNPSKPDEDEDNEIIYDGGEVGGETDDYVHIIYDGGDVIGWPK